MNDLIKTGEYTAVNPKFAAPINPRVAAINAQVAASPLASQGISQAPSVINSSFLQSTQSLNLPQNNPETSKMAGVAVQGMTEGLNTGIQGMISAEDKKIADYQAQVQAQQKTAEAYIKKLEGKGAAQVSAETTAGIPEKTQALTDITNEYNTKALEYRRMEEAVMKEGTLTDVQKNARLSEISRIKNTELADIGIKQAVAQNNLTAAQNLVDRKIDLEYGDLKDIIGYQRDFLNDNRADLTKAEQNLFTLKVAENERKYEEGKSIGEFAKTVAANGAPANVISAVSSAKTMAEAVQAAGQYAGDVLERAIKYATLREKNLNNAKLDAEVNPKADKKTITGDPIVDLTNFFSINKTKLSEKESSALGVIVALDELAGANPNGEFAGLGLGNAIPKELASKNATNNRQFLNAIDLTVQQWASGASLTAQQIEQVNKLVPKQTDSDWQVKNKINGLAKYMLTQIRGGAIKAGVELPITSLEYDFSVPNLSNEELVDMDSIINQ